MAYQNPYIVQSGDSLWKIARKFGYTVDYLYDHDWNSKLREQRPDKGNIQPGDKVYLPPKPKVTTREKGITLAPVLNVDSDVGSAYNAMRLNIGIRPLFIYADIPDDQFQKLENGEFTDLDYLVSGRSLFYWIYDSSGVNLDTATDWQSLGKILPQGIGYIINGFMVETGPYKQAFEGITLNQGDTQGTFWNGQQDFIFGQANVLDTAGYFSINENGEVLYNKYAISQFHHIAESQAAKSRQNYLGYSDLGTPYIENYSYGDLFPKNPFMIYNPWENSPIGDFYNKYPIDISPNSQNGNPFATVGYYAKSVSPETFYPERKYGFFLFPSDMGGYLSKPFADLTKMNATDMEGEQIPEQFIATEVEIQPITEGPVQMVKLHCTLPEWDFRLSRQIDRLESVTSEYMKEVEEDQRALALLRDIKDFTNIHLKYPYEKQSQGNIDKKMDLITKLTTMEEKINSNFIDPENKNKRAAELLSKKEREAKTLWDLLQSESLRAEIKAYETANEDDSGLNLAKGPYTYYEPNWTRIYMTIAKAYRILSYTKYGQEIYDTAIEPVLEHVGAAADAINLDQTNSDEISNLILSESNNSEIEEEWKELKEHLNLQEELEPDETNLFLSGIYAYTKFATDFTGLTITNAPGPPALFLELLDVYGVFAFKSLQGRSKRTIKMSRAFKALVFLMEKVEGRKMSQPQVKDLLKCIYGSKRSLKRGFDVFYRFKNGASDTQSQFFTDKTINNANQSKQFKAAGACYKGVITVLGAFNSIISTVHYVQKWEGMSTFDRLKGLADLGISYTGTTMSIILLVGKFKTGTLFTATAAFAEKFNVYISFYFAAMSAIECGMAIYNGDVEGAITAGLNAAASLMIPIGYMLVAAGLVPGIGHALMIVGLAIQLGLLFWPHIKNAIRELIHSPSYLQVEQKIEAFENQTIQGSPVMDRYSAMKSEWDAIKEAWKQVEWQRLSWRAIVPLHLEGYDMKMIKRMVCVGIRSDRRDLDFWDDFFVNMALSQTHTVEGIDAVLDAYTWDVDELLEHYFYLIKNEDEKLPGRTKENGYYAQLMTLGVYTPTEYPELNENFPDDLFKGFRQNDDLPIGRPPEDFKTLKLGT